MPVATQALALDISKAFDRVWNSYGISGQILCIISSFISNRFIDNRWLQVDLDGKSSQKYPVNAGVPQGSILDPILSLLYINNELPDDVICSIAIYTEDTTRYSQCDQVSGCGQQQEFASEVQSDLQDTIDWGGKWLVDFNAQKTQMVLVNRSNSTGDILRRWVRLSLLNWIGALI